MSPLSADPEAHRLLRIAIEAQRAGQPAAPAFRRVLARAPDQPVALNALGMMALNGGDPVEAAGLFRRAAAADASAAVLRINLATACRMLGDDAAERDALLGALAIERRDPMALIRLAELHERRGERAQAQQRWGELLTVAAAIDPPPPALAERLDHARRFVAAGLEGFAKTVETALAPGLDAMPSAQRHRFVRAMDVAFGRQHVHVNSCEGLHYPFLPADEFFDRALFPWLPQIEAQTHAIRAELEALLADGAPGFAPYVAMEAGTPPNKWTPLDHRADWSAFHLWRHGLRIDDACARCPRTAEALAALPLAQVDRRSPTAFFSILRPGVRLPAHTGVTNTRAIVHLPLIVPPGCGFRVGGEIRSWREGEAFAFDDTIEHEAWNDSDQIRAVLIFDTWNPHLGEAERAMLRDFFAAADASGYDPATMASAD